MPKRGGWLAGLCLALVIPSAANAATRCTDAGSADAKRPDLGSVGAEIAAGSLVSFLLGLKPSTFPAEEIAKIPNACERGSFNVGSDTYTVRGANSDHPTRFTTSASRPDRTVFLAAMPRPKAALDWHRRRQKDRNTPANFQTATDMMYAVVVTRGSKRDVYEFFDKIPDDTRLAAAMCHALAGKTRVFATFDVDTADFEFSPTASAPAAECRLN
jgi:hypothetical protein